MHYQHWSRTCCSQSSTCFRPRPNLFLELYQPYLYQFSPDFALSIILLNWIFARLLFVARNHFHEWAYSWVLPICFHLYQDLPFMLRAELVFCPSPDAFLLSPIFFYEARIRPTLGCCSRIRRLLRLLLTPLFIMFIKRSFGCSIISLWPPIWSPSRHQVVVS